MSDAIPKAISELQDQVRALEEEASQVKVTINLLCKRAGLDPIYADTGGSDADVSSIRADTFYGQALNTAVREYLSMRRNASLGPATVREIYDALMTGGYQFNAKNDDNAMRSLRIALSKSTHTFHRLPNGSYGLLSWYPAAKAEKPTKSSDVNDTGNPEDAPTNENEADPS